MCVTHAWSTVCYSSSYLCNIDESKKSDSLVFSRAPTRISWMGSLLFVSCIPNWPLPLPIWFCSVMFDGCVLMIRGALGCRGSYPRFSLHPEAVASLTEIVSSCSSGRIVDENVVAILNFPTDAAAAQWRKGHCTGVRLYAATNIFWLFLLEFMNLFSWAMPIEGDWTALRDLSRQWRKWILNFCSFFFGV